MMMAGSSHTKIREELMGCTPAGDCCIAGRWRLQEVRPDFEIAPGLAGAVFFPSLRRSSGFQTLGLPSGLSTATYVDRRHHPARNWMEFLPRRVASLAGLCTASQPWVPRLRHFLACGSLPFLRRALPSAAAVWEGWTQCWGVQPSQGHLHWTRSHATWCSGWSVGTADGSVQGASLVLLLLLIMKSTWKSEVIYEEFHIWYVIQHERVLDPRVIHDQTIVLLGLAGYKMVITYAQHWLSMTSHPPRPRWE